MKATYKPEAERIETPEEETLYQPDEEICCPLFEDIDDVIIDAILSISQIMEKASRSLDNIRHKTDYSLTIKEIKQCMFVIQRLCELSLKGE